MISCDVLVDEVVVDRAGDVLGELAHLMIDLASGRVTHVVIARGGVLGLGEKLHAIPWSAVAQDAQGPGLVVDIARERIERAPGFDRSRWPSMSDPAWQRDIEGYYARKTG